MNDTTTVNCLITSVTGCQFTLSGTLSSASDLSTSSTTVYDTICEGDSYSGYFFDLPAQYETGTHTFLNTFFNSNNCTGGDVTTTLFLTVLPRHIHLYDVACEGTDYHAHGFHYTDLQTGTYTDSLVTVVPGGCDLVTVLHLTVNSSLHLPNDITGPIDVCRNEVFTYSLPNAEGLATFQWEVPDGVTVLTGQGTTEASLYFTDDAPNPATLLLTGTNGCGSGSIPIEVTHHPTYHFFFQDSICTGSEYHLYGFDLARQDSTGWFTFTNSYNTADGCDSVSILQLLVTGTPTLTTLAQPAELCPGDGSTIHVMGENAGFLQNTVVPPIAIGDILCTDNSIVKPSDWPVPGKTAMGIVFYVDYLYEHGWAVHLHDQGVDISWDNRIDDPIDIPFMANYVTASNAIMDLDGYTNTQQIRASGDSSIYAAAYAVGFANGWFLPSVGQLRLIYAEIATLNASLLIASGTTFPMDDTWWYWSSTEYTGANAWSVNNVGTLISSRKNTNRYFRVRSIREF